MQELTTQEKMLLLAKFMNAKYIPKVKGWRILFAKWSDAVVFTSGDAVGIEALRFNTSYEWLMPVWHEFRDLDNVHPKMNIEKHEALCEGLMHHIAHSPISEAFEALVSAIIWHNTLNPQK